MNLPVDIVNILMMSDVNVALNLSVTCSEIYKLRNETLWKTLVLKNYSHDCECGESWYNIILHRNAGHKRLSIFSYIKEAELYNHEFRYKPLFDDIDEDEATNNDIKIKKVDEKYTVTFPVWVKNLACIRSSNSMYIHLINDKMVSLEYNEPWKKTYFRNSYDELWTDKKIKYMNEDGSGNVFIISDDNEVCKLFHLGVSNIDVPNIDHENEKIIYMGMCCHENYYIVLTRDLNNKVRVIVLNKRYKLLRSQYIDNFKRAVAGSGCCYYETVDGVYYEINPHLSYIDGKVRGELEIKKVDSNINLYRAYEPINGDLPELTLSLSKVLKRRSFNQQITDVSALAFMSEYFFIVK